MIDHLDDVALSASLDDEATVEERAHLEGCPACGVRRDELAGAAAAVAAPVPAIDGARREAAIAAAVAARVVPLRRRRPPAWALGAVAAALLAAVLVPLLRADEPGQQTALDTSSEQTELRAAPEGLGEVSRAELPDRIRALVAGPDTAATAATPAIAADEAAGTTARSSAPGAAPCEVELRAREPGLAEVRATTSLVLDGRPGRLVVFAAASELRAYVVAEASCEVMTELTVTP
jgi:hypothetical protein